VRAEMQGRRAQICVRSGLTLPLMSRSCRQRRKRNLEKHQEAPQRSGSPAAQTTPQQHVNQQPRRAKNKREA
jgi:hypothetical protein